MKVLVYVRLRADVLDPQGKAVAKGLGNLGFKSLRDVRVGKMIELVMEDMPEDEAIGQARQMCERLLVNTVIEEYECEVKK